ncbi:anti-sigma factor family protein [Chelativorans sp. YIM 93263]|uniref:anti-sigma factor family protein n=1 Tax=Chelativorans sp. YIM 93263 TaxID=2906648 RepID=UPI002379B0DE|nr:hypothetical protein [Chelativorans sp. YIM 93263]
MTSALDDICEIDLMAYADGLLDDDTARKAAVEAYLEANPVDAARVQDIMRDNEAIRDAYAGELHRPVPARLLRAVREPERRQRNLPTSIAASLAAATLAAGIGWYAGQHGDEAVTVSRELLQEIAGHYSDNAGTQMAMGAGTAQAIGGTLISSPSRSVLLEVPLPDLSVNGYELTQRKRVEIGGHDMMHLVYRADDSTVNLFMHLNQRAESASMIHAEEDGLTVHHWSDGPMGYALAVEDRDKGAQQLPEVVRDAVEQAHFLDEAPAGFGGESDSIASEDPAGGTQQPSSTIPPVQHQFN